METKTEKALSLYKMGKIKEALRVFKTFKIGYTPEERETLQIAYEMNCEHEKFYTSLGYNKVQMTQKAKEIIEAKYPN